MLVYSVLAGKSSLATASCWRWYGCKIRAVEYLYRDMGVSRAWRRPCARDLEGGSLLLMDL